MFRWLLTGLLLVWPTVVWAGTFITTDCSTPACSQSHSGEFCWDYDDDVFYLCDGLDTTWHSIAASGGITTPGGSDTHVQYNNAGAFGGSANFIFDGTNSVLAGSMSADRFLGDNQTSTDPTYSFTNDGSGTADDSGFYWSPGTGIAASVDDTNVIFWGSAAISPQVQMTSAFGGGALAPTYSWSGVNVDTGMYLYSTDAIGFSTNNALAAYFSAQDLYLQSDLFLPDQGSAYFGAAPDWFVYYDETNNDNLILGTNANQGLTTADPMFQILGDANAANGTELTADAVVFGVAKGTVASHVDLMTVDAEGDVTFNGAVSGTSVHMTELSSAPTSIGATWGRYWVDDNGASPNLPFFSDGSDVDYQLAYQSYVDGLNHLGSDLSSSTNDILTAEAGGALDMGDTDSGEEGLIWDFDNSFANAVTVNTMPGRGTNIIVFGDANEMAIEVTRWAALDQQVGTFGADHGLINQREQRFANDFMTSTSQATVNLATANAGNNICVYDMDGTANLRVKPHIADNIFVNGKAAAAEERITSPGNAGDFVCLVAQNATQWVVRSQWPPPGLLTNEITWRADEWTVSGGCGAATEVAMPSGGTSEEWAISCTDSDTARATGSIMMPSNWDAATTTYENVQFSLSAFHDTTETLTCLYDVTCQCIGDGEAYTDTYTTESSDTEISIGITTQDLRETAEQANAIECSGTCAEGDLLRWELEVDATGSDANCANIELTHLKMKYTHQTWHEETP